MLVEQTFRSAGGRKRRRAVPVDLAAVRRRLQPPDVGDRSDWDAVRKWLGQAVGDSTFEIWLAPLKLIAVDAGGALVLAAPLATSSWIPSRFGRVLDQAAESVGRQLRFADEPERVALDHTEQPAAELALETNHREAS